MEESVHSINYGSNVILKVKGSNSYFMCDSHQPSLDLTFPCPHICNLTSTDRLLWVRKGRLTSCKIKAWK